MTTVTAPAEISEREADEFVRRYAASRFGTYRCASLIVDLGDGRPHDIRVVLPATTPPPATDRPS